VLIYFQKIRTPCLKSRSLSGYWVRGQILPPFFIFTKRFYSYRSLTTSQQPPEGYPPQGTAEPRYEPAPAQSVYGTDGGNAALGKRGTVWAGCITYPCLLAGVNKSKEDNAYVQQTKSNTEGGIPCSSYRRWMLTRSFMSRFRSRPLWQTVLSPRACRCFAAHRKSARAGSC